MKKLALTIAIVLGLGLGAFAQQGGGLFGKGSDPDMQYNYSTRNGEAGLILPESHGSVDDANGQDPTSPLGSGIAVLLGLGAAYAVAKKRK